MPRLRAVRTISFARGIPAPECLPVAELADCAKAALERDGSVALSYGSTLGYEPLREWIGESHRVELERSLAGELRPDLLYTIPTFQNPSGVTLSEPRRVRLVQLARAHGLPILEDDPYGLVRFEGDPLPTVFAIAG